MQIWNIATGAPIQLVQRPANQPTSNDSPAISALVEYQGTHFMSASLDGTINIWQFSPQPSASAVVNVAPIAQYSPQVVPCSFGVGGVVVPSVIACAVATGPGGVPAGGCAAEAVTDWLIVSRLDGVALEVVRLSPTFDWGGVLARTQNCRAILAIHGQSAHGAEHLVLAGSSHMVKIFRWRLQP
jgi:hypothetical protein